MSRQYESYDKPIGSKLRSDSELQVTSYSLPSSHTYEGSDFPDTWESSSGYNKALNGDICSAPSESNKSFFACPGLRLPGTVARQRLFFAPGLRAPGTVTQ